MPSQPRFAADIILRTALQAADEVDPPAEEPQELTTEQVERFLFRNWQEIAAKGYWGFSKQGRGAFFVFVRGALPAKLAWNEVTGIYLPAHLVDDLRGGSELVPAPTARKLAEMVAAYNPECEVVVCVANPAWEQWAALQVGHPFIMPLRAYKQSGEHAGMEIG